ncbi:MAG: RNA ligase RtcB family protein [Candidatus Melainabacteria bacterium]|nr:RNA ligase RtcB family protein [Candidatus Melainabacteria bacterium]
MTIKIIASSKNWIEGNAIEQLNQTALLPGMSQAVGMPDLHPGKDTPIGAVFACQGLIYPHLVGNDIGCGMGFWQTKLHKSQCKLDSWTKKLGAIESSENKNRAANNGNSSNETTGDYEEMLHAIGLASSNFDNSLGTIGGGNHFAELQKLQSIVEPSLFAEMELSKDSLYLLVHSGSRGLGEHILRGHQKHFGNGALKANSKEGEYYLSQHNDAVKWAKLNREIIANKFMNALNTHGEPILDVCHNCVLPAATYTAAHSTTTWLHRKGAAPSDQGPVIIPGSRGTLSYLVIANGEQSENLATLAHGAGRKWKRSECRGKLEPRYTKESLKRTELGGRVICEDRALLYEEAPQAYKDIDIVVADLVNADLITVIATFAPIITYKTGAIRR